MTNEETIATERRLLGLLCQSATEPELREEFLSRLRAYPFREVHHQVLFDCLRKMPGHRPELIPSLLPARLVQAGFPDLAADPFLEPCRMTKAEARKLLERLTASYKERVESVKTQPE
ncbi:MAG: hypothetical protein HYS38_08040 [Acidobacteria bacterium]|nr:hypothetical protein [Acidobacteriota bacterium]